tara:strand:- start:38 stop:277 length:240 start_codon:yes stop_codon:yes gene_type:complete
MSAITEAIVTALLGLVIGLVLRKILLMHFDAKDNSKESPTQFLRSTEIDLIEKKQNARMDKTIPELKKQLKELKKIIKK